MHTSRARAACRDARRDDPQLVAFSQLGYHYTRHVQPSDTASIALVCGGLALSALALARLGPTRAYFGSEMGACQPTRAGGFPYGVLPHPMALGALLTFGGMYMLPSLREEIPWLVPTHAALTAAHLAQEILDIHA